MTSKKSTLLQIMCPPTRLASQANAQNSERLWGSQALAAITVDYTGYETYEVLLRSGCKSVEQSMQLKF